MNRKRNMAVCAPVTGRESEECWSVGCTTSSEYEGAKGGACRCVHVPGHGRRYLKPSSYGKIFKDSKAWDAYALEHGFTVLCGRNTHGRFLSNRSFRRHAGRTFCAAPGVLDLLHWNCGTASGMERICVRWGSRADAATKHRCWQDRDHKEWGVKKPK